MTGPGSAGVELDVEAARKQRPGGDVLRQGTKVLEALEQQTDEQLAALAAREGSDGPAFVALVERFRPRVWRICFRLMGNEQDADDAAQEVFVRLFFSRAKFEGRSKYATWVHAIAVRTCLTLRRGRGRRRKHEQPAGEENWVERAALARRQHRRLVARPGQDVGNAR